MNYMKIYNDLVSHAKSQILPENTYVERHHIIMKSLGGSNNKSNLVTFTARQHYIAHLLLYKHYKQEMLLGKDKTPYYKALGALSALIQLPAALDENGIAKRAFKFGSKLFELWKKDLAIRNSYNNKKRIADLKQNNPEKFKKYCLNISKGCKKHIEENGHWWTGKKHSEKTKQKIKANRYDGHGENNSNYNNQWIYNIETFKSKCISKDLPIPDGWSKGRFCKATPEELKQRKHILEEILKLKPASKVTIRYKLDDLKQILNKLHNPKCKITTKPNQSHLQKQLNKIENAKKLEEKIKLLTEQYDFYRQFGWDKFVEKYQYKYSYPNFVQQCKKYVKDFVPQNGKKRGL